MLRRLNCRLVTAFTGLALVGLAASISQATGITPAGVPGITVKPTPIATKPLPMPQITPVALVSGILDLPASQDPLTGWMMHNRANISLQVVKLASGTFVAKLNYSDTQGTSFSGSWLRSVQITPLASGSSIPSQINITLGTVYKTLNDAATLNVLYAGKDNNGNDTYKVDLQVWDAFHKNEWVHVSGQLAPEVTDVILSPKYH